MSARLLPLLALALFTATAIAAETDLSVHHAWIREAPPTAPVLAGYMIIENDGPEPRKLIATESPTFEAIELHRSVFKDGIASMMPVESITVPPDGGHVALKPGDYHLMMMDPAKPLRAGDEVTVWLTFNGGERVKTTLAVRKDAGGKHHEHHHH